MSYRCQCNCEKLRKVKLYLSDQRAYDVGTNLTIGPVDYGCDRSGKGLAGNISTIIRELIKKNPNEATPAETPPWLKPYGSGGNEPRLNYVELRDSARQRAIDNGKRERALQNTGKGWYTGYRYGKGSNFEKGRAPLIRYDDSEQETNAARDWRQSGYQNI